MKILNITKKFEHNIYGGVENLVDSLCNELQKKIFSLRFIQSKKKREKKEIIKFFLINC